MKLKNSGTWVAQKYRAWREGHLPQLYRDRPSRESAWRDAYSGADFEVADQILRILCDTFLFEDHQRFQLEPDDRLVGIYRAVYSRWWQVSDTMELERFGMTIEDMFGVSFLKSLDHVTLRQIVDAAIAAQEAAESQETNSD